MGHAASFILLLSLTLGQPGFAQESTPSWAVERGDYSCTLIQSGSRPARIALEWIPGSQTVTLWGIDPSWMPREGRVVPAAISLRPGPATPFYAQAFRKHRNGEPQLATLGLDARFLDAFIAAGSLVLASYGRTIAEVTLPSEGSSVGEFRRCVVATLTAWGVDADGLAALRSPPMPIGGPPAWFTPSDYPLDALRADRRGTVIARVAVDASGRATNCFAVVSSGHTALDARTCEVILIRSRFEPALHRNGAAAAADAIVKVAWDIPGS